MIRLSIVIFALAYFAIASAQSYTCSCHCCFGGACQPKLVGNATSTQGCSDSLCLTACKTRYFQCDVSPPNGQAIGRCLSTTTTTTTNAPSVGGPYSCQCNCCNTGSYTCTLTTVGFTNAYACQVSACSIACTRQYPSVCVNNQYGQTQGTCVGSTVSTPSGSSRCGCSCCGNSGCHNYEAISTTGCSSCLSACQSIQLGCYSHQNTYCLT